MNIKGTQEEIAVGLIIDYDEETRMPLVEFDLSIYDQRLGHYASVGAMCLAVPSKKEKILDACRNLLAKTPPTERQILVRGIGHAQNALAYI